MSLSLLIFCSFILYSVMVTPNIAFGSAIEPETIRVGSAPYDVAVNTTTNKIYVTSSNADYVSVIDGRTNEIVSNMKVGSNPAGIAVDTYRDTIYVASLESGISVIDGETNEIVGEVRVGYEPVHVVVNADSSMIYASNPGCNCIHVIEPLTNRILTNVTSDGSPWGLAVRPDNRNPY
ncbi:MAG: YncE family protein [Nitrososphaerales archaeon]